ncbi:helix-turn-helix transcriptional regulator [Streptomyces sp. NPDC126497]|uniref:helix-turn-helix domain-containing protein n=1 Tax=Streptomyces sp. NPDC126497 TaxID=3155313 RepID=UPI00332AEC1C
MRRGPGRGRPAAARSRGPSRRALGAYGDWSLLQRGSRHHLITVRPDGTRDGGPSRTSRATPHPGSHPVRRRPAPWSRRGAGRPGGRATVRTSERPSSCRSPQPAEAEAGSRRLPAEARGHRLTEARGQSGSAQRDVATRIGVGVARISRIEHGAGATLDVIARSVEALGGRLDSVADFGDHTLRMPARCHQGSAAAYGRPTASDGRGTSHATLTTTLPEA